MGVSAPCASWAFVADVLSDRCGDDVCGDSALSDPYVLQQSLDDASYLLNAWTAYQFQGGQDGCAGVVRPCASYGPARSVPEWTPHAGGYAWGMWPTGYGNTVSTGVLDTNGFCCYGNSQPLARRGCGCGGPSQVALGAYPVTAVTEVRVDGNVVPSDEYRIDDHRWLVRLPPPGTTGRPHWPNCQQLQLPPTEPRTFQVSFAYGGIVPEAGVRAAIALGCAINAERCGGPCVLPQNTSQVNKDGVSITLVRPTEDVLDNMPFAVRSFVNAVNPSGLRRRPRVMTPDLPREVVRTTWTAP